MNFKSLSFLKDNIHIIEKIVFLLLVVISIIPLFTYDYFTLDGPDHVYNATLISQFIFEGNSMSEYVAFNWLPVPNWTGHFFLLLFSAFFTPVAAERLFMSLVVFSFLYSIRYYILSLKGDVLISYFAFPFAYSFTFLLGFYNFSLGLSVFFFFLGFCKNTENDYSFKTVLKLLGLAVLLYFSHAFAFVLAGVFIMIDVLFKSRFLFKNVGVFWKDVKKYLLVFVLPVTAFMIYHFNQPKTNYHYMEYGELFNWLIDVRSVLVYNLIDEGEYVKYLIYTVLIFSVLSIVFRIKNILKSDESSKETFFKIQDIYVVLVLVLYFFMPDRSDFAGFFSVRLNLLFFLMLVVWFSIVKIPKIFTIIAIPVVLFVHFNLLNYYNKFYNSHEELYRDCIYISENFIPQNSMVYTLNDGADWLYGHFNGYLGSYKKNVFVIDNYEIQSDYFPLIKTKKYSELRNKIEHYLRTNNGKEDLPSNLIYFFNKNSRSQKGDIVIDVNNLTLVKETKHFALYK